MWLELLIILLLTLANGVFSGAELAILSIRKTRVEELAHGGSARARAIQTLRAHPERFLATVQIGITVVGASAAAFGGASLAQRLAVVLGRTGLSETVAREVSLVLVVAFVSYLSLVLGELVPKSLALKFSEPYGLFIAKPLQGLAWLGRPLVWLFTASSNLVLKLFGDRTTFSESRLSPEELRSLVEEASESGALNPHVGEIASRAFEMSRLRVANAMVPRSKMIAISLRATVDEIKRVLLEQGHSRMPVYDGAIDNVVGYVIAKDLLALVWEKGLIVLEDIIRPVYFVPSDKSAVDTLHELQRRRTQLAVIVDEIGGVMGLVTIEDLVEELVGEIVSEHEQPPEMFRREPDGSFIVQGNAPLRDINRALELELPEGAGFSTVAGLILSLAGRVPPPGATVKASDGSKLEVLDASARRIRTVRLWPVKPGTDPLPAAART
jgi:putative hemolysin